MAKVLTPLSWTRGRTDTSDCKACGSVPHASEAISLSGVLYKQELEFDLSSLETSSSARPRPHSRHCSQRSERSLRGRIAHPTWTDPFAKSFLPDGAPSKPTPSSPGCVKTRTLPQRREGPGTRPAYPSVAPR